MTTSATTTFPIEWCREQFPALERRSDGQRAVYLDGPAGSQVPQRVARAVASYLTEMNANHGGHFATSRQSDAMLAAAHQAVADLLGTGDPRTTVFGANMTTLTFAFSRALARTLAAGRRSDRHAARPRRQRDPLGAGGPRRRRDGAPRRRPPRRLHA